MIDQNALLEALAVAIYAIITFYNRAGADLWVQAR
jgi:hypothetical protein